MTDCGTWGGDGAGYTPKTPWLPFRSKKRGWVEPGKRRLPGAGWRWPGNRKRGVAFLPVGGNENATFIIVFLCIRMLEGGLG